ncbi:hypothetical protein DFH27DRAFT_639493 [Peziza echinospora]|nr:hypothetical protein DFH27DRAFT_639493 [Peziza echinospora]
MRRHRTADTAVAGVAASDGNSPRFKTQSPPTDGEMKISSSSPPNRETSSPRRPAVLFFAQNHRRAATAPPQAITPPRTTPLPLTPPDSAAKLAHPRAATQAPAAQEPQSTTPEAPAAIASTATASTPEPASTPVPASTPTPTPHPLRLPDFSPMQLAALRKPDIPLRIRGVDPDTFAQWERRHNLTGRARDRRGQLSYEYNALTGDFAVKCMPSAYHDAVSGFLLLTAAQELRAILPQPYSALGITLRGGTDLTGFRLPGLAPMSRKIPDFALRLSPQALFPALVAEVAFAETWDDLVQDEALHLLATGGVTRVVLAIKLWEAPSGGPSGGRARGRLHDKVFEIRAALLLEEPHAAAAAPARPPLVGALTALVAVFVRAEDEACVGSMGGGGRGGCVPEEPPHCAGIKCIYRHTFLKQDEPCDDDDDEGNEDHGEDDHEDEGDEDYDEDNHEDEGDEDHDEDDHEDGGARGDHHPGVIAIPLHLLGPPQALHAHGAARIRLDLRAPAAEILRAKPEMQAQRAVDAAMAIVDAWKRTQQAHEQAQRERKRKRAVEQAEAAEAIREGDGEERWMRTRVPLAAAEAESEAKAKKWAAYKSEKRMQRGCEHDHDVDDDAEGGGQSPDEEGEDATDGDWLPTRGV